MRKIITWPDGSTEQVEVDGDFNIILDGVLQSLLFGMCLQDHYPSGYTQNSYWEALLTWLQSAGVRTVQFQIIPNGAGKEAINYSPMLNACRAHKMLVQVLITCKWFTGNYLPANFAIGSDYDVQRFVTNCCNLINQYNNILAIAAENEVDLPGSWKDSNTKGIQKYEVADAANYIAYMSGIIKTRCPGIPVLTKVVTAGNQFQRDCQAAFLPSVDLLGWDTYSTSLAGTQTAQRNAKNWLNSRGVPSSRRMWVTETNAGIWPNINNANFTPAYLDAFKAEGVVLCTPWTSLEPAYQAMGFFNTDATPKPSLIALVDAVQPEPQKYQLTIAISGSGTTSPAPGTHEVTAGQSVTITATPGNGFHFVQWSNGAFTPTIIMAITYDTLITAIFEADPPPEPVKYQLTITVSGSGSTSPAPGNYLVQEGNTASIMAIPANGFHFFRWSDGSTTPTIVLVIDQDTTITAIFEADPPPEPVKHIVTIAVTGSGSTSPAPGSYEINDSTAMVLTATPAEGSHFARWSNGSTAESITLNITADISITAVFEPNQPQQASLGPLALFGVFGIIFSAIFKRRKK